MKLSKMTQVEKLVLAACYAQELSRHPGSLDNRAAEDALDQALWSVECFRQALRERKP